MHIEKYKNISVGAILGHIKREHKHYTNENIDTSKSDKNIYFVNRDINYYENRLKKDIYVYGGWNDKNKAKYNSLCSIVAHCPKSYRDKNQFFEMLNHVLCSKFGKENVICSVQHKDENGDHLHFSFIPTIWNTKKKKYQLSYEKCIAHEFNNFHDDIEKLIFEEFGVKINLHSEEKEKDKFYFDNIEDYKKMKLELERLQNECNVRQQELEDLQNENLEITNLYNNLCDDFENLANQFNSLQDIFEKMNAYWLKHKNIMLPVLEEQSKKEYIELQKDINR